MQSRYFSWMVLPFTLLSFVLWECSASPTFASSDHLFIWKQYGAGLDGSQMLMTLKIATGQKAASATPASSGTLTLTGGKGQSVIFCSPVSENNIYNNNALVLPVSLTDCKDCSEILMEETSVTFNYHDLQACPKTLPGAYHYTWFVSDSPILGYFHPDQQKTAQADGIYGGFGQDKGSLTASRSSGGGGFPYPWDDFKRRRPVFPADLSQQVTLLLIPSEILPDHYTLQPGLNGNVSGYSLVFRIPGQRTEYIPILPEEVPNLLVHFTSIRSVIDWLTPIVSGRQAFLGQLLDLQASLADSDDFYELPDAPSMLASINQQVQVVLDLPAADFDITVEKRLTHNRLVGGILESMLRSKRRAPETGRFGSSGTNKATRRSESERSPPQREEESEGQSDDNPDPSAEPMEAAPESITGGAARARDACYVKNEGDKYRILALLRYESPESFISFITHPEDLYDDQLLTRNIIKDGRVEKIPARLFSEEEVVLVIDATQFDPARLAEFNELYDTPSRIHGDLLGPNVRIVTLVSDKMKQKPGLFNENKPASDFWRRISNILNRCDLAEQPLPASGIISRLLDDTLGLEPYPHMQALVENVQRISLEEHLNPDLPGNNQLFGQTPAPVIIDFFGRSEEWRSLLTGKLSVSQTGNIEFMPSPLVNTQGRPVVLLNAPWNEPGFRLRLLDIISSGQLEANGKTYSLNGSQFYAQSNADGFSPLLQKVDIMTEEPDNPVIINLSNFEAWMSTTALTAQGKAVKHAPLIKALDEGRAIEVSSSLSAGQWARLLVLMQDSDSKALPSLFVAEPQAQPEELLRQGLIPASGALPEPMETEEVTEEPAFGSVQVREYQDESLAIKTLTSSSDDDDWLILELNSDHSFPSLVGHVQILSSQQHSFDLESYDFLHALQSGRPILLKHLEQNPQLQRYLEPLLKQRPELLINGWNMAFDQARIYVLVPEGAQFESRRWQKQPRHKSPPPPPADQLVDNPFLPVADPDYKDHIEGLEYVLKEVGSLKESPKKLYPSKPKVLDHLLLNKILKAVIHFKNQEHASKNPNDWWKRAVKTHILEEYRGDPGTYKQLSTRVGIEYRTGSIEENSPVASVGMGHPSSGSRTGRLSKLSKEREAQLTALLESNPVVFIKGEAASGKSYMAEKVARKLNPYQAPVMMTGSPYQTSSDLFRKQLLKPRPVFIQKQALTDQKFTEAAASAILALTDQGWLTLNEDTNQALQQHLEITQYQRLKHLYMDQHTQWHKGPLQQWLETEPTNDSPVFLIVDEANLLNTGLLNALSSIHSAYPAQHRIYDGGRLVGEWTPFHKIILTGNPEAAEGRQSDPYIRQLSVPVFYLPIPDEVLLEGVLQTEIEKLPYLTDGQKQQVFKQARELWQQYRNKLPLKEFNARDLLDISGLLHMILERYLSADSSLSDSDLTGLVWHCFAHSLGGAFPSGIKDRLKAVELWFQSRNNLAELKLPGVLHDSFQVFLSELASVHEKQFSFSGDSVRQLAQSLWLQLMRVYYSSVGETVYHGRRATLIEGPAARGKDKLLQHILDKLVSQGRIHPPIYTSAGHSSWQNLRDKIKMARDNGLIIVISEINLIPSEYLEGELNDILSGNLNKQSPGFHLFATVNPLSYSGRKPLSPALSSRFTHFRIDDYTPGEQHKIIQELFPDSYQYTQPLVNWHLRLIAALKQQGQTLIPTNSELLSLVGYITHHNLTEMEQLRSVFQRQYRFYTDHADQLQPGDYQVNSTPALPAAPLSEEQQLKLYQDIAVLPPVNFRVGAGKLYNSRENVFTLPAAAFGQPSLRKEVVRLFMESAWRQHGLPLKTPDEKDILLSALYHLWQQNFFVRHFPEEASAEWIHKLLSEEETLTLNIQKNQLLIQAARKFLIESDFLPSQANYIQLRTILKEQPTATETGSEPAGIQTINFPNAPSLSLVGIPDAATRHLADMNNGYRQATTAERTKKAHYNVFLKHTIESERRKVVYPELNNAQLTLQKDIFGSLGYDGVVPEALTESYLKKSFEVLGYMTLNVGPGKWTPLPGLKMHPNAWLNAISVRIPGAEYLSVQVIRDRKTGIFLFSYEENSQAMEADKLCEGRSREIELTFTLDTREHSATPLSRRLMPYQSDFHKSEEFEAVLDHELFKKFKRENRLRSFDGQEKVNHFLSVVGQKFNSDDACIFEEDFENDVERLATIFLNTPNLSFYRTLAFWLLAIDQGIPVRMVEGSFDCFWCEYSLDGGYTWQIADPGGQSKGSCDIQAVDPEFPPIEKSKFNTDVLGHIRDASPDAMAEWLQMVEPDTPIYNGVLYSLEEFMNCHLTETGPFSTEQLKEILEVIYSHGRLTIQEMLKILKTLQKIDKKNKTLFYNAIWQFFVNEKAWLSLSQAPRGLSYYKDFDVVDQANPTILRYFDSSLGYKLQEGVDIHFDPNADSRYKMTSEESLELVRQHTPGKLLPKFQTMLSGLTMRTGYRDNPPGDISIERLLEGLPAYRTTDLKPQKRALLYSPVPSFIGSWFKMKEYLKQHKHLWGEETVDDGIQINIFEPYLHTHLQYAFFQYLFDYAGGREGTLKMFFPADHQPEEIDTVRRVGKKTYFGKKDETVYNPQRKTNTPLRAGYIYPKSILQMGLLLDCLPRESLTPPISWLKKIYRQTDILLLHKDTVFYPVLMEFLDSIDFPDLVAALKKSNAYKKYKEEKKQEAENTKQERAKRRWEYEDYDEA